MAIEAVGEAGGSGHWTWPERLEALLPLRAPWCEGVGGKGCQGKRSAGTTRCPVKQEEGKVDRAGALAEVGPRGPEAP